MFFPQRLSVFNVWQSGKSFHIPRRLCQLLPQKDRLVGGLRVEDPVLDQWDGYGHVQRHVLVLLMEALWLGLMVVKTLVCSNGGEGCKSVLRH